MRTPPPRTPARAAAAGLPFDYLASDNHYISLAGRILAALRGGAQFIAVTGELPAAPQPLAEALRQVVGARYTIIEITCGPELALAELLNRGAGAVARSSMDGNAAMPLDAAEVASPLFIFYEADRLSDQQIEEMGAVTKRGGRQAAAGVLLAAERFLTRFDQPPLQSRKEGFAFLRFDEIGNDETIDFLRHQLAARQSQEEESRIRRPILLRGLGALGALAVVVIGVVLVLHHARERPVPAERPGQAIPAASAPAMPTPLAPPGPPASSSDTSAAGAAPDAAPPPRAPRAQPGHGLSAQETATLVIRGDSFLSAGDIASARLFYERAADVGSGAAALRLGATFDPNFLSRAGVLGSPGDPAQAAAWYRRALDLGDAAAAERLKGLSR